MILDILEETTGARMSFNYNTIGGVMADLHPDFQRKVKEFCRYMPGSLKEYHELFTGNVIAQQRMKGIGVISREKLSRMLSQGLRVVHRDGLATCVNAYPTAYMTK